MSRKRKVLKIAGEKTIEVEVEEKIVVKEKEPKERLVKMVSLASELGFSISLPIVGGALLGQFLDNKFNTTPRMTLSFIFLGLFIGITNIFLIVKDNCKD